MKNIIAFAGSNSKKSINKQLAVHASGQLSEMNVTILDLNDFELPVFGVDLEAKEGIHKNALKFLEHIKSADGIILSLAEHNGAYSTAFKNIFDWMSRVDGKLWSGIPMLLMATSPGGRGGASVLEIAKNRFPHMGGNIVADFSLPSFGNNFSEDGITDEALNEEFKMAIGRFQSALK
ncbi:NADPH-dependent FMN reductase [Ulvibacter antarcticus]|uniref:NAD(P)H-dependent FMN reductase n=1 Tax=Ulvibacter antarcticus TaxID=442714 RepID=A0A3L9YKL4_9FLAO|nr:NAD(P)H-dependent oxidoreductase [Ulvibacter antarcticus]RMA58665.1 NAD(P)H-dependent FMN reductase [Ulvibacter antarcticus]